MGAIAFFILFGMGQCQWTPPSPADRLMTDSFTIYGKTTDNITIATDGPRPCTFKTFATRDDLRKWLADNKLPDTAKLIDATTGKTVTVTQTPIERPTYDVKLGDEIAFKGTCTKGNLWSMDDSFSTR